MRFKIFLWYYLPVFLLTGLIFRSSSQTYSEQSLIPWLESHVSNTTFLEKIFSSIEFTYAGHIVSVETVGIFNFLEFLIRKTAHFTIYFLLAILIYRLLRLYIHRSSILVILAILLTFLYAVSDEFHQSFTKERTPLFEDVLLDTLGGVTGVFFWLALNKIKKIYKK